MNVLLVSHDDFDGYASLYYLAHCLARKPSTVWIPCDYHEVSQVPRGIDKVYYTEVYNRDVLRKDDVLLDHHAPRIGHLSIPNGMTGYLILYPSTLMVSPNTGKDYSNVTALRSILSSSSIPRRLRRLLKECAVPPPERISAMADIIDNPELASTEQEMKTVVGHFYMRYTGLLLRAVAHRIEPHILLDRMAEYGDRAINKIDVEVADGEILISENKSRAWRAAGAVFLGWVEHGLRQAGYGYIISGDKVRITLVSRDRWALEAASRLGGGGRKTVEGYIGGAVVSLSEIESLGRHKII